MSTDFVTQALDAIRRKDFAAARMAINAYRQHNPLELQHYLIKGLSEMALEDWNTALETFLDATEQFPHQPQLWLNLGVVQENLNQIDDAAESLEHSLSLKPEQGNACGNLSNLYRKQGRFRDAEAMAHRARELGVPKAQALNCLGLALGKQGKFDEAIQAFGEALQIEPNNADIIANVANLAIDRLDFVNAWPLFAKARALDNKPVIRRDEGLARLLAGQFATGWPLYEARIDLPTGLRLRPACPRYNGEVMAGKKIMLLAEQGFGDTIMFCRYGHVLTQLGAEIFWVVQQSLKHLLSENIAGPVFAEREPLPEADYYIPLLSLPLATHRLTDTLTTPYLKAPDGPKLPNAKAGTTKIGLVWTGSRTHERDHERSIPLEKFATLLKRDKTQFYAPFKGAGLEEITNQTPVIPLNEHITDFADTAALLKQLDCLITVDTAVAHLAGALGVKTYLLLQHSPDWRWGTSGEITPWYSSMTLLRQPKYGDWYSVIINLGELLG
jgi:Flp pilus assembly protein TadD